jgi:hypothetical protein
MKFLHIFLIEFCMFLRFKNTFENFEFFFYLLQIDIFFVFSDHFDMLISKIIFKK